MASFLSDHASGRTPPTEESGAPLRTRRPRAPEDKTKAPRAPSRAAALLQSMQTGRPAPGLAPAPSEDAERPAGKGKGKRQERRQAKAPRDRNTPPVPTVSAMEAILTCLARREHSQKELRDRLKRQGHAPDKIEEALERAVDMGYQSDERFARSLVRFKGARKGNRQVSQLLNQHRLSKELVADAMEQGESELVRAVNTLRGRYENKTPDPAMRQKATNFMIRRGFGFDVIKKAWKVVFEGADIEEM